MTGIQERGRGEGESSGVEARGIDPNVSCVIVTWEVATHLTE